MTIGILAAAVAVLGISGVVDKGPQFFPYKARLPEFSGGEGGDHTSALGIEVWSNGAPARPFEILGVLTDNRQIGPYAGPNRDGYVKIIARGTRSAGGDAAILDKAVPDAQMDSGPRASQMMSRFLREAVPPPEGEPSYKTRFWVIKYLPPPDAATKPSL
jgi:hypothetical protein